MSWRLATIGRFRCHRCGELIGRAWVFSPTPVLTTMVLCELCVELETAEALDA